MLKQEIDTPALLIDIDLMEKNLETMASFFRGKKGKYFRPHYKTPKSPFLAAKQIESGASRAKAARGTQLQTNFSRLLRD